MSNVIPFKRKADYDKAIDGIEISAINRMLSKLQKRTQALVRELEKGNETVNNNSELFQK